MEDELYAWMRTLLLKLEELLIMVGALDRKLSLPDLLPPEKEVWLTMDGVLDELCITPRTFYRRRNTDNWVTKKSGSQVYYLKSSLRKG